MKVRLICDLEIDGVEPANIDEIMANHLVTTGSVILSEQFGEPDEWAIIIKSVEAEVVSPSTST